MPIYEYQCRECGIRLEKLQKLSDPPLKECPGCEAGALVKLVSAASFRLKGGGWYETDFKKDGKRNVAGDDKPPERSDGKSSPASGESPKPAPGDSGTGSASADKNKSPAAPSA